MKAIKLYKDNKLYFEGTCEIGEIEDVVIEPDEEDYSVDKSMSKLANVKRIINDKKIDVVPYRNHPEKIMLKIQYDKAKDTKEQLSILAKAVFE